MYTLEEVSGILRISLSGARLMRRQGRIKAVHIGRRWLVSDAELNRLQTEGTGK